MIQRLNDTFLQITLAVSITAVSAIILFTFAELVARSAGAPLYWSADLSAIALCVALTSGLPYVTRSGAQIAVTLSQELAPPRVARVLQVLVEAISCVVCAMICVLCFSVALQQFKTGVSTVAVVNTPRWVLSGLLAYGFAASGVMHLLNALDHIGRRPPETPTTPPVAGV
jgi:TRAP-type C4-dicarboxylate transport system permease small subunit